MREEKGLLEINKQEGILGKRMRISQRDCRQEGGNERKRRREGGLEIKK